MEKIGVFVSYNHKDKKIAETLVESLTSLSEALEMFIDHASIKDGDDYEKKISESIAKAQWFICICSGGNMAEKDMSWSFFEAGQFRAKLKASHQSKDVLDRICFLYDSDRPSQFNRYQGTLVSPMDRKDTPLPIELETADSLAYENTELFGLLKLILEKSAEKPLREIDDNVRKLMRNCVRKLTLAFVENRSGDRIDEEVFQPRISFLVPSPSQAHPEGLAETTVITGEFNALPTIFTIAGTTTTWGNIKSVALAHSSSKMMPLWIHDMEAAIKDVALGKIPKQTDFLCLGNDGKFYRPIIARNEIFRNKAKRCYVAFIPSRDRRFNLSFKSSLLLSGLILSIRFRQRVLPIVEDIKKNKDAPEKKRVDLLQKLQSEIILIESEAEEFGLTPPQDEHDDPPILNGFREEVDKDSLRDEIKNWTAKRIRIFDKIEEAQGPDKTKTWGDAAGVVIEALGGMKAINSSLIEKICDELLRVEKIESQEASAATVSPSIPAVSNANAGP